VAEEVKLKDNQLQFKSKWSVIGRRRWDEE
jgi:hypothetical protein